MFNFWRSVLMDEAGGAGDGGGGAVATMDAGAESTALTVTGDTDVATTEPSDAGESTDLATQSNEPLIGRDGRPSKTTSAALQSITATHPRLAKAIQPALAMQERLRKLFPNRNPFDGIRDLHRSVETLRQSLISLAGRHWDTPDPEDASGRTGIQQIRDSLADMEELDLLFSGSDPRMLDKMTQEPEAKVAFTKLFPHAMTKQAQLAPVSFALSVIGALDKASQTGFAPKAYSKHFSTVFFRDAQEHGVDLSINRLLQLIPAENKLALDEVGKLVTYFNRLVEFSKLAPETSEVTETKVNPDRTELDQERQRLAQDRLQVRADRWNGVGETVRNRIFTAEWNKQTNGMKMSEGQREGLIAAVSRRINFVITGKADNPAMVDLSRKGKFYDEAREYFDASDNDGYMRFLSGMYAKEIPRAITNERNRFFPGQKPAAATATTTAITPKVQADAGFKRVGTPPAMNMVNRRDTLPSMWKNKQAILRDGTKVQWG